MKGPEFITSYLEEVRTIASLMDVGEISNFASIIQDTKKVQGRLFILGVGGSAANASHAVNDFRKILGIESYAINDNSAELTARINDDGWDTCYSNWLKVSNLNRKDCLVVLSVGGGSEHTSVNLVNSMELAKKEGARIISIVSRDGGVAKKLSDSCVMIPVINEDLITPHAEEWQGIIWHLIVSAIK